MVYSFWTTAVDDVRFSLSHALSTRTESVVRDAYGPSA
jgi:hypothetical protein